MFLAILGLALGALLTAAYFLYGGWVARQFRLDDTRATPAVVREDGVDFVPTKRFYLFGQHFSAIAAAGPIAGPILACQAFGWGPCLAWIAFGVVFIGAVHDFSTLAASVRHGGRSIAEIAHDEMGPLAGRAMMAFIWIALVYVIVAFADITAGTFVAGTEELREGGVAFHAGGAVAAAAVLYLALALVLGLVQRFLRPPLWLTSAIFVPATFAACWAGTKMSTWLLLDHTTWAVVILGYCALASVLPVWMLLQPRGYLGGFVLYSALAAGLLGVLFGGYEVEQPFFRGWDAGGATGGLFPFLFVTIACGACSGFHGLVCSGTTSKQIERESDCHAVGYGAMLAEGFVALIALVTIMIAPPAAIAGLSPGTIYGNGIGRFLSLILGEEHLAFAVTFGAMAFSTFVFDTIDVSARLGRYLLQELFGWKGLAGAAAATVLTLAPALAFVAASGRGSWVRFWTLFGASNQLLAALTLLVLTLWLRRQGKRSFYTFVPMLFVAAITIWALAAIAANGFASAAALDVAFWNGTSAAVLLVLALVLGAIAWRTRGRSRERRLARMPDSGAASE
jgi:carbon starvation protein